MLKTTQSQIPRTVWILGFVSLLTDVSSKMVQSTLPLFLVAVLGSNLVTVGLIEGIAEATASVLKIFSGALSDYWGRRKQLAIAGYGLSALITPLFAIASSPAWVLVARFGDRFGKGIRVAPRNALVADTTPAQSRGAAFGLRQSLDTIGAFTGPLVAAAVLLQSEQNFRLVFWLATIPAAIGVLLLVIGIREPSAASTRRNPLEWNALQSFDRSYWLVVVAALLFNLGNSSDAFLLLKAQEVGLSTVTIPLLFVVANLTYGSSAYPAGVLSDRIGRFGLFISGLMIFALVYLGFAFATSIWQIWILFAFYGLYLGMSQGVLLAIVADRVPAELRGTAFGLINLVTGIALLPASLIAGALWQKINSQVAFATGSGFALLAIGLLIIAQKDSNRAS